MKIQDIKRILIVGAGTMGQQIGLLCALNKYDVVMFDIYREVLEKALERIKNNAARMVKFKQYSKNEAEDALLRIMITENEKKAAEDVDLISESVPEDPELKGEVFARFNRLCKPETIFTTNTSSLIPSMFASESGRPENLCALHFHDVAISKIVDVMPHSGTSSQTIELVKQFAEKIGQIPIVLKKEHNGYVFNNMLMALLDSSLSLASKGIASVEDIDRSWMGVMHTISGPFGIMDSVGLETVWKITDYWAEKRNDDRARANAGFLKKYVNEGKIGVKSNQGFYKYPDPAFMRPDFLIGKGNTDE
ncbi:MAG: 3-hydroxyacyl-CoA dehydrogenase [Deltaproteobacteria bacterium]|nr:3-hydroxyacyl-CoA dehydrogenase [Deltaproteobacteria bacterium]MBW2119651.1 3-hydroxyacyl-CoA dehydrogenase [Deltaproteobacteria bacterium]MBW2345378.1 3-hydroxyacyl-CoA dehydrogenase [Deltaproteobacteria bacterium]